MTSPSDAVAKMTPDQWFEILMGEFDAPLDRTPRTRTENTPSTRRERLDLLWSYYIGDPPLPFISEQYKPSFKEVLRKARNNYAAMAVDVMTDRSVLDGIATDSDGDIDGDDLSRQIMDFSGFTALQRDMQTYLFVMGEAYVTIIPPLPGVQDALPMLMAEDPRYCVGLEDPTNPNNLLAFVKVYTDKLAKQQIALLFVGGQKYTWLREPEQFSDSFNLAEWTQGESEAIQGLDSVGSTVPVVKFTNKIGSGEFESVIDVLDRIMDGVLQRQVIMWYQSFRQRAVVGSLDGGEDFSDESDSSSFIRDVANEDVADLFQADPGALWVVPEGVSFWESSQADLTPQLMAIRDDVKEFAAATRTPLHIITPDAAQGSAEGAALMREALVDKITDRQARQSAPWMILWKMVFASIGQDSHVKGIRLLWGKVERATITAKADAIAKTTGVLSRERQLVSIWEMTPAEAKENETELLSEAMAADSQFGSTSLAPQSASAPAPADAATPSAQTPGATIPPGSSNAVVQPGSN